MNEQQLNTQRLGTQVSGVQEAGRPPAKGLMSTPSSSTPTTDALTKVIVADDEARLRSALRLRLEHESGIRVVGEATNVGSLLAQAEAKLPDILLVDWELPGLTVAGAGLQLLRTLRYWFPQLKVIALSSLPEAKEAALAARVDAFVSKAEPADQLVRLCQAFYPAVNVMGES